MKISRRQLRNLINESITLLQDDPTDDPRFGDPSYSGGPGSYTYMGDNEDSEEDSEDDYDYDTPDYDDDYYDDSMGNFGPDVFSR